MRSVNHITMDFFYSKKSYTNNYWMNNFLVNPTDAFLFLNKKSFIDRYGYWISISRSINDVKFDLSYYMHNIQDSYSYKNNKNYSNNLDNQINVNFLRQERLYTKLKYSRSPAYDIVSGGIAALFAGLLGFLVSEKFGMELVDSGDFYYVWMYIVFIAFSLRPIIVASKKSRGVFYFVSIRRIFEFYIIVFNLIKLNIK